MSSKNILTILLLALLVLQPLFTQNSESLDEMPDIDKLAEEELNRQKQNPKEKNPSAEKPGAEAGKKEKQVDDKKPQSTEAQKKEEAKKKKRAEFIDRVKKVLKFGNSRQVRNVLGRLPKLTAEEQKSLVDEMKTLFKTKDVLVQAKLARVISDFEINDLDEELLVFFNTKSDAVFLALINTVIAKKIDKALPLIQNQLKETDFTTADRRTPDMLRALTEFKDKGIADFLHSKAIDDKTHFEYRTAIIGYFGKAGIKHQPMIDYLMKVLKDEAESLTLRSYAAFTLSSLEIEQAKVVMKEMLDTIENLEDLDEKRRMSRLRLQLISGLVRLKDGAVVDMLVQMARDDDEVVRLRAVRELGRLQVADARELLEYKSKHDPDGKVRNAAKKALEGYGAGNSEDDNETDPDNNKNNEKEAQEKATESSKQEKAS